MASKLSTILAELKRRRVYHVAVVYAAVGVAISLGVPDLFSAFDLPNSAARLVIVLIAVGFPIALVLAWAYEVKPESPPPAPGVPPGDPGTYSPRGDLGRRIRRPVPNRPVTPQDVSALKRDWLGDDLESWMEDDFGRWVANVESPETMPPYGRVLADLEGNLWVWEYDPPGNPVDRATLFDPGGRMLGTVETPPASAVFQIGADYLLTFIRDSMDLEHIEVFRINKR